MLGKTMKVLHCDTYVAIVLTDIYKYMQYIYEFI